MTKLQERITGMSNLPAKAGLTGMFSKMTTTPAESVQQAAEEGIAALQSLVTQKNMAERQLAEAMDRVQRLTVERDHLQNQLRTLSHERDFFMKLATRVHAQVSSIQQLTTATLNDMSRPVPAGDHELAPQLAAKFAPNNNNGDKK